MCMYERTIIFTNDTMKDKCDIYMISCIVLNSFILKQITLSVLASIHIKRSVRIGTLFYDGSFYFANIRIVGK